jgi:hypothetical protein
VAQELAQVFCIVHLHTLKGLDRLGISLDGPFFLLGCADR